MDKVLMIPYLLGAMSLVVSMSFLLKQEHINQPLSQLWWPLKYPLGGVIADKSLLTPLGIALHGKVINFAWWFARLILIGLLVNIVYALFSQ